MMTVSFRPRNTILSIVQKIKSGYKNGEFIEQNEVSWKKIAQVRIKLSLSEHAANIVGDEACFYKAIPLEVKLSCPGERYLRYLIRLFIVIFSVIVIMPLMYFLVGMFDIITNHSFLDVVPLLIILLSLTLVQENKPVTKLKMYLFDASGVNTDINYVPIFEERKCVFVSTRILHPKFSVYNNSDWLNLNYTGVLKGLKINILRVVMIRLFEETGFIDKLLISLQLHRIQLLAYILLISATTLFAYIFHYDLEHNCHSGKIIFRFLGVAWWCMAIYLGIVQMENVSKYLEKSRRQYKSNHLPLFVWNPQERFWRELHFNEITKPFMGEYGLGAEKIVTLTQGVLLVIYITSLGLL